MSDKSGSWHALVVNIGGEEDAPEKKGVRRTLANAAIIVRASVFPGLNLGFPISCYAGHSLGAERPGGLPRHATRDATERCCR